MSKISEVKTHPLKAALKRKQFTAQEARSDVELILVEVRTDDGLAGYGEITTTPMKDVCAWVARFGEIVRGMDALAVAAVWDKLFLLTSPQPGIGGLPRGARTQIMAAIGGIDMALWDIQGKAAGMPVFRLLGAEHKPVFTYATGGYYVEGAKPTACADELAGFVANGFKAVKLKTGAGSVRDEAARVARDARRDRRRHRADARHERRLRSSRLHRVRARGRAVQRVLARRAAALVSAAGRFRAPRARDADSARARRARDHALHHARLHRERRHPLRAVRRHARRRFYRGAARRAPRRSARRDDRAAPRAGTALPSGRRVSAHGFRRRIARLARPRSAA